MRNTGGECWYFDSRADSWGERVNLLYNDVHDTRSRWVLGASLRPGHAGFKYFAKDLETFINLLPVLDEQSLAYFRSDDGFAIIALLKRFVWFNQHIEIGESFNESKFDDGLDFAIACDSIRTCIYKIVDKRLLWNNVDAPIYELIGVAVKLEGLECEKFREYLEIKSIDVHSALGGLSEERLSNLLAELEACCAVKDREKEAVKIIIELSKVLPVSVGGDIIDKSKKILQFTLKSKEAYEQLKTALVSLDRKELEKISTYYGSVFLSGSGQDGLTKWEFSDGFLFVEGKPDTVLTLTGARGSSIVGMAPRSLDPGQRWKLIKS